MLLSNQIRILLQSESAEVIFRLFIPSTIISTTPREIIGDDAFFTFLKSTFVLNNPFFSLTREYYG